MLGTWPVKRALASDPDHDQHCCGDCDLMVFREEHCQAPLIFDVARTPVADLYRFAVESASVSTLTGGKRDFFDDNFAPYGYRPDGVTQSRSGFMPANFTTFAHFSVSSEMSFPKSAGEPASGVPPSSAS